MKKIISIVIVAFMLTTSISFAGPNNDSLTSLKELNEISSDIGLVLRNIVKCGYDKNNENKTLNHNRGIVKEILSRSFNNYNASGSDLIANREASQIINIASLYAQVINSLAIYLEDTENNESYLFNAIAEYNNAITATEEFNNMLKR